MSVSNLTFETLNLHVSDGLAELTLNRPDAFNAMNRKMVVELREFFGALNHSPDIRVVVLAGAGRHFCAGLDIKESAGSDQAMTVSSQLDRQRHFAELYLAMRRCPQPIISKIQGAASGGGFALALASDVRILTPNAKLNAAFIKLGLSGCYMGLSYFLPRLLGIGIASELLLTGRFLTAERAERLGLASTVVSPELLDSEALGFASDMLAATPLGLRLTKDVLNQTMECAGLEAVMALEDRNQMLALQDENFREGMAAFLEKRAPRYV